jgi:predicted S18 family serine protease
MKPAIELSNSNINGTNSTLSIIVLLSFIYFTIITCTKIYIKKYPNDKFKEPNVYNAILQNTMQSINNYMAYFAKENIKEETKKYTEQIQEKKSKLNDYTNTAVDISTIVGTANEKIYSTFNSKLQDYNDFLTKMQNVSNKIKKLSDDNITYFGNIYKTYQEKLKAYVDNLVNMMRTIGDQIEKATAVPSLFSLIKPLQKVFVSIKGTLENNMSFIKQFYPTFTVPTDIDIKSTIKPNVATSFKLASSILKSAGYK